MAQGPRIGSSGPLLTPCYVQSTIQSGAPGGMIANSIPARLVATRMRVALPRARACPCHAHVHGHTMHACAWPYYAHAQGYAMHRDLASKIVQPVKD